MDDSDNEPPEEEPAPPPSELPSSPPALTFSALFPAQPPLDQQYGQAAGSAAGSRAAGGAAGRKRRGRDTSELEQQLLNEQTKLRNELAEKERELREMRLVSRTELSEERNKNATLTEKNAHSKRALQEAMHRYNDLQAEHEHLLERFEQEKQAVKKAVQEECEQTMERERARFREETIKHKQALGKDIYGLQPEQLESLRAELAEAELRIQDAELRLSAQDHVENSRPDLCCPITKLLFKEPVCASDGHIYEKSGFERWLAREAQEHERRPPLRGVQGRQITSNALSPTVIFITQLVEAAIEEEFKELKRKRDTKSPTY